MQSGTNHVYSKSRRSTVSTQKVDSMVGHKLLVIEPYRVDPETRSSMKTTGRTLIAVDTMGAGKKNTSWSCRDRAHA